jgi:protein farnesyltransferase subunit beta
LSAAQNHFEFADEERFKAIKTTAAFGWKVVGEADVPCEENDRVKPVHPVFVVPFDKVEECRSYFEQKEGF